MGLNDQSLVDVRKVLTGKDGQLFVTVKGQQYLLSESNEFSAQLSVNNTDYQPSGWRIWRIKKPKEEFF